MTVLDLLKTINDDNRVSEQIEEVMGIEGYLTAEMDQLLKDAIEVIDSYRAIIYSMIGDKKIEDIF